MKYEWTDRDGVTWEVTTSRADPGRTPLNPLTVVHLANPGVRFSGTTDYAVDPRTSVIPGARLQQILDEARRAT